MLGTGGGICCGWPVSEPCFVRSCPAEGEREGELWDLTPLCVPEPWVPASLPAWSTCTLLGDWLAVCCGTTTVPGSHGSGLRATALGSPTGSVGRQALLLGRARGLWDAEVGDGGTFPSLAHPLPCSSACSACRRWRCLGPGAATRFIPFLPGLLWVLAKAAREMRRLAIGSIVIPLVCGGVTVREGAPQQGCVRKGCPYPQQSAGQRPAYPWLCRFSQALLTLTPRTRH